MTLTVVTAVHNAVESGNRENLIRCVRSVAALKVPHEHLIYDGASTDGTVELLRELEREMNGEEKKIGLENRCTKEGVENRCTRELSAIHNSSFTVHNSQILRVVSEPDTGIYNALNKGVRDAQGEWFYVLGCDDFLSDAGVLLKTIARGNAQNAIMTASPVFVDDKCTMLLNYKRDQLLMGWPCPHQGVLMRTAIVRKYQGFDESFRIAGDYDLFLRMVLSGEKVLFTHEPFAYYCTNGISSNIESCLPEFEKAIAKVLCVSGECAHSIRMRTPTSLGLVLRLLFNKAREVRPSGRHLLARYLAGRLHLIKPDGTMLWH